jgi:hypothetical protein
VESPKKTVDQRRRLMGDKVERVVRQVAVQNRNGGGPGAFESGAS